MNTEDPILLTVYLLFISYFISKIIGDFNDEFTIKLADDEVKSQLEQQKLQDTIAISFRFDKQYEFAKLDRLNININNKSDNDSVYVDWDCSVFTDLNGRSRRVTRLPPGTTLDLFQDQVFSTVGPKMTLREQITAEDLLERKGDAQDFKVTKPILDLKPKKPSDALREKLGRFMKRRGDLEFFLELAIRVVGPDRALAGDRAFIMCKFVLKKLPWQAGLPWNPTGPD